MSYSLYHGREEQRRAIQNRLDDAQVLLNNARRLAAMYLAGYAVECALKVGLMVVCGCYDIKQLEDELHGKGLLAPDKTIYTHNLSSLLKLTPNGYARAQGNPETWKLFTLVNRWDTAWRYADNSEIPLEAKDFVEAAGALRRWVENNV